MQSVRRFTYIGFGLASLAWGASLAFVLSRGATRATWDLVLVIGVWAAIAVVLGMAFLWRSRRSDSL